MSIYKKYKQIAIHHHFQAILCNCNEDIIINQETFDLKVSWHQTIFFVYTQKNYSAFFFAPTIYNIGKRKLISEVIEKNENTALYNMINSIK